MLDVDEHDADLLASDEAPAAAVVDAARLASSGSSSKGLGGGGLVKCVVLEVLLTVVGLLLGAGGDQAGGAADGGADAGEGRGVEVEEERGQAGAVLRAGEPPEGRRPWVGGRWDTPGERLVFLHRYI